MRILALAHQYVPAHNAGAEVMLHAMLRALAGAGHEVVVLLSRQGGDPYVLDGVYVRPERDKHHAVRAVLDSDVVITHLENTPRASILGRLNDRPVITLLHNTMQVTKEWLAREMPALAVANSQWMHRDIIDWFGERERPRIVVVRPPVDLAEYRTTPGDRVTLINLRKMEQSPGGMMMGKGSEVFWELAHRMPGTDFLGVRGSYGAQDVRTLRNVEVLDHVPHGQIRDRVYARTRVLLMPSSYESWGRVGVEAMCSGIPVIAHPTPGLVESLGPAGIFVDRDDVDGWRTVLAALDDPDRYAVASAAARARAAELDPADDMRNWCDQVEEVDRWHRSRQTPTWKPASAAT